MCDHSAINIANWFENEDIKIITVKMLFRQPNGLELPISVCIFIAMDIVQSAGVNHGLVR
jgi:hypothetical protein